MPSKDITDTYPGWQLHATFTASPNQATTFKGSSTVKVEVEAWATHNGVEQGRRVKATFKCTATEDGKGNVTLTPSQGNKTLDSTTVGGLIQMHAAINNIRYTTNTANVKVIEGTIRASAAPNGNINNDITIMEYPFHLYVKGVKGNGNVLP